MKWITKTETHSTIGERIYETLQESRTGEIVSFNPNSKASAFITVNFKLASVLMVFFCILDAMILKLKLLESTTKLQSSISQNLLSLIKESKINTFLPYACFRKSAESLDNQRLGKQRVECLQLARAIAYQQSSWRSHPAAVMWQPYLNCLIYYGMTVCKVWQEKGFRDSVWTDLYMMLDIPYDEGMKNTTYPSWLGSNKLHSSHRANLLRKDIGFYRKHGWTEQPREGYYWPAPTYDWRSNKDDKED